MCNACLIEDVKTRMLSRRALFSGAAAMAAAGMAAGRSGAAPALPALAQAAGRVVDLTHAYDGDFPTYDGKPSILYEVDKTFDRDGYHLFKLSIFEHTGTHIDAPLHFAEGAASVEALPVEALIAPLCVVDIAARAAEDPNATVEPDDIEAWMSAHGAIPAGACVAMNSGWGARIGDPSWRNLPDGTLAFPGFSRAAVDLLAETGAASIGVDTLSLDPGNSPDFAVHHFWLPRGRFGIEALANLDRLPPSGATIFIGAPSHLGGTGGPARVLALL